MARKSNELQIKDTSNMRRQLLFTDLDEVSEECQRLLEKGYTQFGNWSLGQVCRHMRLTIEKNIHGYPTWMLVCGYPLRPFLRAFGLPKLLSGKSPQGLPTAGEFVPPENLDDAEEVSRLQQCIAEFKAVKTKLHAHPGFGNMSHEKFNQFHAAHASHHLGFLQLTK